MNINNKNLVIRKIVPFTIQFSNSIGMTFINRKSKFLLSVLNCFDHFTIRSIREHINERVTNSVVLSVSGTAIKFGNKRGHQLVS